MFTVGLTGGIGSGKSTVAHLFARHDITILMQMLLPEPYANLIKYPIKR